MSRVRAALRNSIVAIASGLILVIIGFVTRAIFVGTLGIVYVGIYGLFQNIIAMLAVAELGFGAAIIYHLYKPLHEKDKLRVSQLMVFYRRLYRFVALAVTMFGLAIMPFLPVIAPGVDSSINLYMIFAIFIVDAALSYLMSYKRSVLYADQNNHLISAVHLGVSLMMNVSQIAVLIITENFYLYLVAKVVAVVTENLMVNIIVARKYPYLTANVEPLDDTTRKDIYTKTKGLLFHKLGSLFVLSTDNVIISIFLGVKYVGLYSNYLLITEALSTIFWQASTATTASVGNLLLSKNKASHYAVFRRIYFLNMWIATLVAVGFFVVVNNFIIVWLGASYIFSTGIVAVLSINMFLMMMRTPIETFKTAGGIFYIDRHIPAIESVINLVISIILVQYIGIIGVFIGTLCTVLFVHIYAYPKYTYSHLFDKSFMSYWLLMTQSVIVAFGIALIAYWVAANIATDNKWLTLVSSAGVVLVLANTILVALYYRTAEFAYYTRLIKRIVTKLMRRA